jgi:putative thioredoxin
MDDFELRGDFYTEVLMASHRQPVVVDFWAAWCGPCRVLGPVLEKLAAEAQGAWRLVKVDTEAHPQVAGQLEIRAIPTVMLFRDGQAVSEFQGALPEDQVRAWLAEGIPGESAQLLDDAKAAFAAGDPDRARKLLDQALASDPGDPDAKLLLARLLFSTDVAAALAALEAIPEESPAHAVAEHLKGLAAIAQRARDGSVTGPDEDVALYAAGADAAGEGRYEDALTAWLELLGRNRKLDDDGARRAMVALFALLGDDHPLTQSYRRRLASMLY